MTEKKAPNKRNIVDWNKKSASDSDRLLTRSKEKNKTTKKSRPPRATGKALLRLREKIKELYEDDDYEDQEDLINNPLYQIKLIQDEEDQQKKDHDLLKINRLQQLTSKLNIIMNTAISSIKANLNGKINSKDMQLADKPELSFKEVKVKSVEEKITKPLNIEEETPFVSDEMDAQKLAKIVLEKTGRSRKKSKKSLVEITQELHRFKDIEQENLDENKKE